VQASGAIEDAREIAAKYTRRARAAIADLPAIQARDQLARIVDTLLARSR
jgi:geranylgeranyl pyrophosphate synthase